MSVGSHCRRLWPQMLPGCLLLCVLALNARGELWRTGYYTGWEQASMPAASIDFGALTHIVHFSLAPSADGTLNESNSFLTAANSEDLVTHAHAAGVKVLVCLGGSDSQNGFQGATSDAHLPVFINKLTNFLAARNYDGVDIDWEPLPSSDARQYTNLVAALRSALNGFSHRKLLTAAVSAYPPYGDSPTADYQMFSAWQGQFDQINIMTYDLSGPYSGWVTWFNSPIYDCGYRFPSSGGMVPSVDGTVSKFLSNGVAPGKLGIAIAFYGYVWTKGTGAAANGLTQPRQSWTNTPSARTYNYNELMSGYYRTSFYHWDEPAGAAYLSVTNENPPGNAFVSYDDPRACQSKVNYARSHNLGGIIMWELAQDHLPGAPDPLLEAVKQAIAGPGPASSGHDRTERKLTSVDTAVAQPNKDASGQTNQSKRF